MKKYLLLSIIPFVAGMVVLFVHLNSNPSVPEIAKANVEALAKKATASSDNIVCDGGVCVVANARNRWLIKGCVSKERSYCEISKAPDQSGIPLPLPV